MGEPVHEVEYADNIIAGLTSPTSSDAYRALHGNEPEVVAAIAVKRVLEGGGGPAGSAGGVLSGTFPNPGFAVDMATQAELNAVSAETLLGRVYNVLNHGLIDDDSTDNTSALQALINTIPTTGFGRLATFLWPYSSAGKYQFNSQVNWGHRSIRNVGVGASPYNNPPYCTTVTAGADSITMFSVDGGGTLQSQSPSFEHLIFSAESHTGVTGLEVANANRCHLRTVSFVNFDIGVSLDEAAEDCAWHDWRGVHFYGCTTGVKSITSNSWNWWGGELTNCTTGIDCVDGDQIQIAGIKINPKAEDGAIGIKWGGSETFIQAVIEHSSAAGVTTALQVDAFGGHAATGQGNKFELGLHGGIDTLNNVGIDLLSGAVENIYEVIYETSYAAGKLVQDAGTRNTRVGGPMRGTIGARPMASQHYRDRTYWSTDTGSYAYCDGSAWHTIKAGQGLGGYLQRAGSLNASAATSHAIPVSGIEVGNTVFVCIGRGGAAVVPSSITDDAGNTYTIDVSQADAGYGTAVIASANIVAAPTTITVNEPSSQNIVATVEEFSGVVTPSPFDKSATTAGSGATTTPSCGPTAATTQAAELVLAVFSTTFDQDPGTWTAGTGYTGLPRFPDTGVAPMCVEFKSVSSTGAQTADGTFGTSSFYVAALATYKRT